MGLELLFCRSSEDVDDENGIRNSKHCVTKKAGLESVIPRLQTLVVCSGLGPRSGKTSGDDKCDLHVRSLLAGNEKLHLAEVKLLRSAMRQWTREVGIIPPPLVSESSDDDNEGEEMINESIA